MNTMPRALVLRAPGINCDLETERALRMAGFDAVRRHINEFIRREASLTDFHLLVFPGGLSFGDYISAGKVFAVEMLYRLREDLDAFLRSGDRYVVGICNGFQVLVKMGILPDPVLRQTVTLAENASGRFECRWVTLRVNRSNPSPLAALPDLIQLPVAHGEGRFLAPPDVLARLETDNRILFRYASAHGDTTVGYPFNPNGSMHNIAGITDAAGRIIGLMPHPERYVSAELHPGRRHPVTDDTADGLCFFRLLRAAT